MKTHGYNRTVTLNEERKSHIHGAEWHWGFSKSFFCEAFSPPLHTSIKKSLYSACLQQEVKQVSITQMPWYNSGFNFISWIIFWKNVIRNKSINIWALIYYYFILSGEDRTVSLHFRNELTAHHMRAINFFYTEVKRS